MPEALPDTMTCIEIQGKGGPEVLRPARRPLPVPGPGEVLVKVAAAGVNRPDVVQRQGLYPPPPGITDIPGLEIAGAVVTVNGDVGKWKIGDTITALVAGGGYAEYCAAPAVQCLPIPRGLGLPEAAAIPETFFTVWSNVFDRAGLKAGETLLVHGGTSGIGTTAIQLAHALGAKVIATAGSPAKCAACRALGADLAIDYRQEDFVAAVADFTARKGVDVILDMVGGTYMDRNLRCLGQDGRLVSIAFLEGAKAEVNFLPVMLKRLTLTGSTLRAQPVAFKGAIARSLEKTVWPLLDAGTIRPKIHAAYPLAQADQAHILMESSQHIGKIILTIA